jgi:hypothetical protein
MTIDIPEGYESLGLALGEAAAQASHGKGAERHAEHGEKFSDQLIMSIPKRLGPGGECFCLGQAVKKIFESRRLAPAPARAEILGAINYLAAAWSLLGGTKSVFAPEDRSTVIPLFAEGERVKYAVQGKWEDGAYVGVDPDGKHVVSTGSSYVHLDGSLVRKA